MFVEIWRIGLLLLNGFSLISLISRFFRFRKSWHTETFNLWATLILWSIAGGEIAVQGLIEVTPFSARTLFVTIASFATPVVLRQKTIERRREVRSEG